MTDPSQQSVYYVVFVETKFKSFVEAKTKAPREIETHIARSKELHRQGSLLMSGAFLDDSKEGLSTMAVHTSRQAAEDYIKGDPFYLNGMINKWYIREWANMFVQGATVS